MEGFIDKKYSDYSFVTLVNGSLSLKLDVGEPRKMIRPVRSSFTLMNGLALGVVVGAQNSKC
jgi:hypothetical protein